MMIAPQMLDAVLALIALEAVGLGHWLRRSGRRSLVAPIMCFLAAGGCLMLAVRLALSGDASVALGTALIGGFAFHVAFFATLLRRGP